MPAPNSRQLAIQTAATRQPRTFPRPLRSDGSPQTVREYYGSHAFGIDQMRAHLPADVVRQYLDTARRHLPLELGLAERIAHAVLDWAATKGVTHFCHWFQPMTGATAEKHDSFLSFDDERPIAAFSGAQLIQSEPDASSFPSGGMRTTFEARGYTAWDPSSPIFIMERETGSTLCIPSVFISYHGAALDKKTPVLRSMEVLNKAATRVLHQLGDTDITRVNATAGPEQEYFLVDAAYAALRPDLVLTGRTLLGAPAPKGQALDDHYFGAIASRALAFMQEVETELYKLGVPAQTRHNEVAPSQFELAVLYSEANRAADHNQLVMSTLEKVAARHSLKCLLHEKPFAGVNGSGKHLNWSVADSRGRNLLNPSDTPHQNLRFLTFLAAVLLGVHRHASLLRATIGTHGNDFRLGANEAPPAIISVFLGETLTGICDSLAAGRTHEADSTSALLELGVARLPQVARDNTDRNRTSPFAFTGNKFEFRALGSSQSISFPLTVLNTAVADALTAIADDIDARGGGDQAVLAAVQAAIQESTAVRFEGNGYSEEWVEEAERRGLPHFRKAADALEVLRSDETIATFTRMGVLTPAELDSRYHVYLEQYITTVEIEVDVMRDLIDQSVMPSAIAERTAAAADVNALRSAIGDVPEADLDSLKQLSAMVGDLRKARCELDEAMAAAHVLADAEQARALAYTVMPALEATRAAADALEARIADHRWELPRYRELLFQN